MEVVFSEQLFPADFPVIERTKCWISFFSAFDENDVKALERILQQKQRSLHVYRVSNSKSSVHTDDSYNF